MDPILCMHCGAHIGNTYGDQPTEAICQECEDKLYNCKTI